MLGVWLKCESDAAALRWGLSICISGQTLLLLAWRPHFEMRAYNYQTHTTTCDLENEDRSLLTLPLVTSHPYCMDFNI